MTGSKSPALFSVIIPLYNREDSILRALDSVLDQTYRPIEIVIVDDGSTDNSRKVVDRWSENLADEDNSINVITLSQLNGGASQARNRGLEESNGDYIQYLDSDDFLHPERLSKVVQTFEDESCEFIQTGFESIDHHTGEIIKRYPGKVDSELYELALSGGLWANTLRSALASSLAKRIGPWKTDMICFEDREYMERAIIQANKAVAIEDILATAVRGGTGRLSDKMMTREGRTCRICCELQLANSLGQHNSASESSKMEFKSRIYGLAMRSAASRWPDLARKCVEIADGVPVESSRMAKRRRAVWRMGFVATRIYALLGRIKAFLRH